MNTNGILSHPKSGDVLSLTVGGNGDDWGMVMTNVGHQAIPPQSLCPTSCHPNTHIFGAGNGRVLNGVGSFSPQSMINAGMAIMLFPEEWHSFYPIAIKEEGITLSEFRKRSH